MSTIIFILTTQPELDEFHDLEDQNVTENSFHKNDQVEIDYSPSTFAKIITISVSILQAILVLKVLDHLTMVFFTLGELNNEKYFPLKNIDLQGGLHFLPDSISKHFCLFHFLLLNIDIVKSRLHSCVIQIIGKIKCYFLEFYQNFSFRIYCSIFLCSSKMEVHQESSEHC